MKPERILLIAGLMLVGCSPGVVDLPIENTEWSLRADTDNALVDVAHAEFGRYPNPRSVNALTVTLQPDGELCATDGADQWCGGPLQGIPYVTILNVREDSYCIRVVDMYGNYVRTGCKDGTAPHTISSVVPDVPGYGEQSPGEDSTDQSSPTQDGVVVGTKLVIDAVNAGLVKMGLNIQVPMPEKSGLADFEKGDLIVGKGTCADVNEYLKSEFSDDHPGTDDYVFGPEAMAECLQQGRCRVGQLVTRAMAEACAAIPTEIQASMAEAGIVGGGGHAVAVLCEGDQQGSPIDRCVGSPLVLDLAGDGVALKGISGGVTFPLFGSRAQTTGWLSGSDDALLALDLDGDGAITSGRELFGEATGRNGFSSLARYDDDHDGAITERDAVFHRLLAWQDDGDGRSRPDELHPIKELGLRSIPLRYRRSDQVDPFGNELRLHASATGSDDRRIPVVDVWFRMGR